MKKTILVIVLVLVVLIGGSSVYAAGQRRREANRVLEITNNAAAIEEVNEDNISTQVEYWENLSETADSILSQINTLNLKYIDDRTLEDLTVFYSNLENAVAETAFYNAMIQTQSQLQVQNQTRILTKTQAQEMLRELAQVGQLTQGYSLSTEYNSFVGDNSELNKFQKLLEQKTADASNDTSIEIDESGLYQYLNQFAQKLQLSINERVQARDRIQNRLQAMQRTWIASPTGLVTREKAGQQTQDSTDSGTITQEGNQNESRESSNSSAIQSPVSENRHIETETETEQNQNAGTPQNQEQEVNQNLNSNSDNTGGGTCGDGVCRNGESQSTCNEDCN